MGMGVIDAGGTIQLGCSLQIRQPSTFHYGKQDENN